MSSLLERNSDIKDLMNQGELVPDTMVRSPPALCSRDRVIPAGPHFLGSRASCPAESSILDTSVLALSDSPGPATLSWVLSCFRAKGSAKMMAEALTFDALVCSSGG